MQLHVEVPVQLASELSEPFTAFVNDGQLTVFVILATPHASKR